jgi:ArsR family transcriptional regulator
LTGGRRLDIVYRRVTILRFRQMTTRKANRACCSRPAAPPPPDPSGQRLAELAWALAHPARVRIVRLLLTRQGCLCGEIVEQLPLAQSTVSQHLKILKEAGLIEGTIDGPKVCYCISPARLQELKALVARL